jgi:phage terminase large subunit-like protein
LTVVSSLFGDVAKPSFATQGPHARWFIETHCTHAKGEWFGQPLLFEPWALWVLNEMLRVDPKTGLRYWRQYLEVIPRKNAKSTRLGAKGYYFLCGDSEGGPEGFSAAWGEQQARNTFDAARTMHDASPKLQRMTRKFAKAITCPDNAGSWRVVSRIAETQQGTNPHFALIDEYHVHQRSDLYDAFKRGTQARRQPMIAIITTEGDTQGGPLGEMQRGFLDTADIEMVTPYLMVAKHHESRSLMIRWGVPWGEDADIEDPAVVRGCNPAGWLEPQRLIDEYLKAPGAREKDFRRYHLNQLVVGDDAPITAEMWDACRVDGVEIPDGVEAFSASDLGFTSDWSAHMVCAPVGDRLVIAGRGWAPPDKGETDIRSTVDKFARGEAERLRMETMLVDKWNARLLLQEWGADGLPVAMFSGENQFMCPASVSFLEAVKQRRVAHDGCPDLRAQVLNLRTRDIGLAWKFVKHPRNDEGDQFKTDMALCAVAAVHQAVASEESALETHGIYI